MSLTDDDDFMDELPIFVAKRTEDNRCQFKCPVCKRVNTHGISKEKVSHRCGHCKCWPDGYMITVKD
jgi:hypothetical protein